MKSYKSFSLILTIALALSACTNTGKNAKNQYNSEQVKEAYFISNFNSLWAASINSNNAESLTLGDTWDTDAFSMSIKYLNSSNSLSIEVVPKVLTIPQCFESDSMLIYAISNNDDETHFFIDSELFYMSSLLESVTDYSASATMRPPSDGSVIHFIIVTMGTVYTSSWFT